MKFSCKGGLTPLVEWEWWSNGNGDAKEGQRERLVGRIGNLDGSVGESRRQEGRCG